MNELEFLVIMGTLTLIAGVCSGVFSKFKLPPVIGYLLAGIIIVNVVGIPASSDAVIQILSDLGLVMLMFCIGMELNLEKLKLNGRFAMVVAIVQLPLMILLGYIAGQLLGMNPVQSITLGAVISGSSTAVVSIVLRMQERITKEEAETMILVTVMEDVGQVMILSMVAPMFVGASMDLVNLCIMIAMIVIFMLGSIFIGIKFVPAFLNWVGKNTSSEVLLILSLGLCFGLALLSVQIGMSMAIGSFLMGVIVSKCVYCEEITEKISPMKDLFMGIFFISIGMEVMISDLINCIWVAIIIFITFAVSKFVTVFLGYFVGNRSSKEGFIAAVSLMAMGEFAFIISKEALDAGVVDTSFYTAVIGAAIISMIALPIISRKMFNVIDWYNSGKPKRLIAFMDVANDIRDDFYSKVEASSEIARNVRKNANKVYVSIFMIVVIEVIFILLTEFLTSLMITRFGLDLTNAHVILMVSNFLLLTFPTSVLVTSVKKIDKLMLGNIVGTPTHEKFYRSVMYYSTALIVAIIDFLILLLLPGPFGGINTLIIVPIALAIFLVGMYAMRRKRDRESMNVQ